MKKLTLNFLFCALLAAALAFAGSVGIGSQDVAAAGTAEALTSTSTPVVWVIVQAKTGNTNPVYVGDSTVAAGTGPYLDAGDSVKFTRNRGFPPYDLASIYVDATTNGEGVTFIYYAR